MDGQDVPCVGALRFVPKPLEVLTRELNSSDRQTQFSALLGLRGLYLNSEKPGERQKAGRALGYSNLRMALHELWKKRVEPYYR